MKIWQKILGSSTVLAGFICLMGISIFNLYQAEILAEKNQKETAQVLNITNNLEKFLKNQVLVLKDFVILDHNIQNMIEFQKIMSNFRIELDKLETLMGKDPEVLLVRRHHTFLTKLANGLDNNIVTLVKSQEDIKAINAYVKDISFHLSAISQDTLKEYNIANANVREIRRINTNFMLLAIIGIFLILLYQLIFILPVIRSLHKLQVGVAEIGAGDLNYHLDIQTNDEIEQLANNFNQMTSKLSDFYQCLESRVTERTTELFQLNQDLETEIADRRKTEIKLKKSQAQLTLKAQELEKTLQELQEAQTQLIQTEKMSSLGQLVAGVAHEINNPVNFIHGNIEPLKEYLQNFSTVINLYRTHYPQPVHQIENYIKYIDLEFILKDTNQVIASLEVGTKRIREIVLSLRNFSRLDEADMKEVNLHEGIDNTLLILQHRIKEKPQHSEIEIIKEYGDLPLIECYPGQLNQVFMNILNNAIDAMDSYTADNNLIETTSINKKIIIKTKMINNKFITIHIADNGAGIPAEIRNRIFDPFFTTKPVGKGTGLGLSISYQIVTATHRGSLQYITVPGKGTEFIIKLPIKQKN
ncbi:HAMP domain-containing sensor histidine kinase [Trichormus azollae]|jgi:signal transduction histidine kinase|uniref:histidine kinase n=1 Tax=Nostoc azollae (strain 0708) TaxID=551115 RepID=D7E4N7_NOSA0|nr:ATP-binding protein [Trichormus azollae]ADI65353.1 integral membrane sensor signal transduction histidine kinase ['Nostoc azollae' 0708]